MVQFLSINFFSWISSIFVGFFKSSLFCVILYLKSAALRNARYEAPVQDPIYVHAVSHHKLAGGLRSKVVVPVPDILKEVDPVFPEYYGTKFGLYYQF